MYEIDSPFQDALANTVVIQHYRYWVIWRCPTVRFLDYQKVKDVERKKATDLFGTASEPTALASTVRISLCFMQSRSAGPLAYAWLQIIGIKSRTFDIPASSLANGSANSGEKSYRVKLTEKEKKKIEKMIKNAKSLQEISRLEKELNEGRIPGGAGIGDDMEE